jgi:molecular chaperone GrpE
LLPTFGRVAEKPNFSYDFRRIHELPPAKKSIRIDSAEAGTKREPTASKTGENAEENVGADAAKPAEDSGEVDHTEEVEQKLEAAIREAAENYDRMLRVTAEFENYKKRSAREMDDFRKFANQELVKDLLPILDNLELAIKSASENAKSANGLLEGIELTRKEILRVLEKHSVKQIEALGMPFDPSFHEAVMREETNDHPENTVTNELQKGYLMHDRLIRPSMVAVAMPIKKKGNPPAGG